MARRTRVLLVDDDPSLADLMANQLSDLREEFSIRVETDASDALDAIDQESFDCVLSDYHMPGIDGLELLGYVREMEPNVPFILFTARGSEEIASEAVSGGVTDYFRKRRGSEQWRVLANRIENAAARYRAEEVVGRREAAIRRLADTVVDGGPSPAEDLLELGRETLEVEYAALVRSKDDPEVLLESVDPAASFATDRGNRLAAALEDATSGGRGAVVTASGDADLDTEAGGFGVLAGAPVYAGDERYGTLCFCDRKAAEGFPEWERAFVELLAQWLGNEATGEWVRAREEDVRSARDRLAEARAALEEGDDAALEAALGAADRLLEREPPSVIPVPIELS